MIAYKFDMPYLDTLKAVLINFPDMLEDMSDRRFKIMVWRDLDEAPIYEGVLRQPVTTGINKFIRFALSEELILSSGEFYVGWLQTLPKKLYVGFDFNNDHQQEIFYSVNNGIDWFNTSFQGSLLIRPDFGYASVDNVGITEVATPKDKVEISVYPNPATTHATIVTQEMESLGYRLMDVSGRMIHQGEFYQTTQLSLQGLQTGVYFLHIFQPLSGISQVETIFVR